MAEKAAERGLHNKKKGIEYREHSNSPVAEDVKPHFANYAYYCEWEDIDIDYAAA